MSLRRVAPGTTATLELAEGKNAPASGGDEGSAQRAALLRVRERIDEMLAAVQGPAPASRPARVERLWMRICEFARTHHYSTKTISQWCKLGMPHIGSGHYTRINVREAEKWIADDGPKKAAMMMGMIAHAKEAG